jgi:hypothetical protein
VIEREQHSYTPIYYVIPVGLIDIPPKLLGERSFKFKEVLKAQLIEQGLWFKDGETRQEWYDRLEVDGRSALRRFTGRKTGKVGVHQEAAGDGGGGS